MRLIFGVDLKKNKVVYSMFDSNCNNLSIFYSSKFYFWIQLLFVLAWDLSFVQKSCIFYVWKYVLEQSKACTYCGDLQKKYSI